MYRDEEAEPPLLVCQVGSTKLTYDLRAIEDLHRWLSEQGDWVPLGAADEKKPAVDGTVEAWGRSAGQPGRRLVWPAQGLPGPLRHVPPAPPGGARPGRGHPRGRATTACAPSDHDERKRSSTMRDDDKVIRYRTKPEHADENERLIRGVFAELAEEDPTGCTTRRFRLEDGVSFVHVAVTRRRREPAASSPAFAAFQADIGERCAEGPNPAEATVVGNFDLLA